MEKDRGKERVKELKEFQASGRVLLIRAILETGLIRERTNCGEAAWEEGGKTH